MADSQAPVPPQRPRRVLVIDDNRDSADSLAMLLRVWGHEARAEHDGPAGIAAARTFAPDFIFLDLDLPGMSGFDVVAVLRASPLGSRTVIVATTGFGQEADFRRSRENGFDDHLVKPLDPVALRRVLSLARPD